jgi:class 3 adenylate cyclase
MHRMSADGRVLVLSEATAELVELALTDLGDHRFKDIPDTVSIFRLGDDDSDPDEPLDRIPLVEEDADAREEVSSGFV